MAEYRLAPAVVLRSAGAAFVLLAVAVLALSVVTALAGWSFLVVGVVAGLGLLGVVGGAWWAANRAYVVRLDSLGYEVRLVRGAGVNAPAGPTSPRRPPPRWAGSRASSWPCATDGPPRCRSGCWRATATSS